MCVRLLAFYHFVLVSSYGGANVRNCIDCNENDLISRNDTNSGTSGKWHFGVQYGRCTKCCQFVRYPSGVGTLPAQYFIMQEAHIYLDSSH